MPLLIQFLQKNQLLFDKYFVFTFCKISGKDSHRNQLKHCSVIKWGFLTTSKTSFTEDLVVNRTTVYIFIFLGRVVPTTLIFKVSTSLFWDTFTASNDLRVANVNIESGSLKQQNGASILQTYQYASPYW